MPWTLAGHCQTPRIVVEAAPDHALILIRCDVVAFQFAPDEAAEPAWILAHPSRVLSRQRGDEGVLRRTIWRRGLDSDFSEILLAFSIGYENSFPTLCTTLVDRSVGRLHWNFLCSTSINTAFRSHSTSTAQPILGCIPGFSIPTITGPFHWRASFRHAVAVLGRTRARWRSRRRNRVPGHGLK